MFSPVSTGCDACSDAGRSPRTPRTPLSLKALRAVGAKGRVASAPRRNKVRCTDRTVQIQPRNPKQRKAWVGDEALWLSDNFLYPVDRHQLSEAPLQFPPQYNEEPRDRSFTSHRAAVKSLERRSDEESHRLFSHVPVATADLSELPRRRRVQLLGGLLSTEKEVLPRHRLEAELEPMRHVNVRRARCEFSVRWGKQRSPRYLPQTQAELSEERPSVDESQPGCGWPSFEILVPGVTPREIFKEHEKSKPTGLSQALQQLRLRRAGEAAEEEATRPPHFVAATKNKKEEDAPMAAVKFEALLQELRRLTADDHPGTLLSASSCSRMADLGRQLEVQSYDLRFSSLLQTLVAVGTAAARVEAASQPTVTDRLHVREHWRRKHEDLWTSARAMADAVSAQSLTANLASVVEGLKALAESGTCCQERLDCHLARLKELFREERVSPRTTATVAGSIGLLLLPGPHGSGRAGISARDGATPQSRSFNVRFIKDFGEMVLEAVPDYAEAEFKLMGWIFPTAYLDEGQMRQLLGRAAEIQVGLRPLPDCEACRRSLGHIVDFVRAKMPRLNAALSEYVRSYCEKIKQL